MEKNQETAKVHLSGRDFSNPIYCKYFFNKLIIFNGV